MLQEFKDFVNRGNFIEIAVAFVIGLAFAGVISTLTGRIVTPLIGMIFGVDFEKIGQFGEIDPVTGLPAGSVGAFLESIINFIVIAFVMFLVVKAYNAFKARNADPAAEAGTSDPEEVTLLREIRDSLATRP